MTVRRLSDSPGAPQGAPPLYRMLGVLAFLASASTAGASPADQIPTPRPEPCIQLNTEPEEGEIITASGLSYGQVRAALSAVIQTALYCEKPERMSEVHLTFELVVGCDGVVSSIEPMDMGGAPETYVHCVQAVIAKADFDAHDMPDGQDVTYPVDVAW